MGILREIFQERRVKSLQFRIDQGLILPKEAHRDIKLRRQGPKGLLLLSIPEHILISRYGIPFLQQDIPARQTTLSFQQNFPAFLLTAPLIHQAPPWQNLPYFYILIPMRKNLLHPTVQNQGKVQVCQSR